MNRIRSITLALSTFGLAAAGAGVQAQQYPTKPVRLVVPYAPGGPADVVARTLGQKLTELWGQPIVIENRGGAGGSVGTDFVAKSPADGYTLLLGNSGPITINPTLIKGLGYDPEKDLDPITLILTTSQVLLVNPHLPVKSIQELVTLAKARPGQLNYGSSGVGNLQHLIVEALQLASGTKMNHVPYKGSAQVYVDLFAGQLELMFGNTVGALPYIKTGRVRALGVSSLKRLPQLPDVPAIAEVYPGFELVSWLGFYGPKGLPPQILQKINSDTAKVLAQPEMRERSAQQGAELVGSSPEQLHDFARRETALYAKIIRTTGMKAE